MNNQKILFLTSDEVAAEIGKQIKEHRIRLGKKQADFAERIGMAYSTYQLFERTGKISLINFISVLAAIGKKDVITRSLELDTAESVGIGALIQNKDIKKRKRVR